MKVRIRCIDTFIEELVFHGHNLDGRMKMITPGKDGWRDG